MKKVIVLLFFLMFIVKIVQAQIVLYNHNGIVLTYTNSTLKTVTCTERGADVYFVTAYWTVTNNSSKAVYVNAGVNMNANGPISGCYEDEILHFIYKSRGTEAKGVLQPGNSVSGEDGNWFAKDSVVPWWSIKVN